MKTVRSSLSRIVSLQSCFFFQAEDGIRDGRVTEVQTCALPIYIDVLASATDWPRSKTSGAELLPFCWLAALISSWLAASGWVELTLMPYLSPNALMMAPRSEERRVGERV